MFRVQCTDGQCDQEGVLKIMPEHASRGKIDPTVPARAPVAKHPAIKEVRTSNAEKRKILAIYAPHEYTRPINEP